MSRPKWLPYQQLQLWHDWINLRLSLDQIVVKHNRPTKEVTDRLQEMEVMNRFGQRIGKAAKTDEEKSAPRIYGDFNPAERAA